MILKQGQTKYRYTTYYSCSSHNLQICPICYFDV